LHLNKSLGGQLKFLGIFLCIFLHSQVSFGVLPAHEIRKSSKRISLCKSFRCKYQSGSLKHGATFQVLKKNRLAYLIKTKVGTPRWVNRHMVLSRSYVTGSNQPKLNKTKPKKSIKVNPVTKKPRIHATHSISESESVSESDIQKIASLGAKPEIKNHVKGIMSVIIVFLPTLIATLFLFTLWIRFRSKIISLNRRIKKSLKKSIAEDTYVTQTGSQSF
jgi:hypothetical protein